MPVLSPASTLTTTRITTKGSVSKAATAKRGRVASCKSFNVTDSNLLIRPQTTDHRRQTLTLESLEFVGGRWSVLRCRAYSSTLPSKEGSGEVMAREQPPPRPLLGKEGVRQIPAPRPSVALLLGLLGRLLDGN